jgi:hypothetical protein
MAWEVLAKRRSRWSMPQEYDVVLWTRADTQEALISGFVAFAALLELSVQEERDQLKIVQAVKHWLTSNTRCSRRVLRAWADWRILLRSMPWT